MRKHTSLLLCGVALATLSISIVEAAPRNATSTRGSTTNDIQVTTAGGLSGNTDELLKLFNTAVTDAQLQELVGASAKQTSTRAGLFRIAKTDKRVSDALMNRLEGDVTFRDQIILDLVLETELVQLLLNNYASTHPKAAATLAAASQGVSAAQR